MAAAGRIVVGNTYEDCFADELIKMARVHYARQGARTTKVVKVAHMGRRMAQQKAVLEKIAFLAEQRDMTPEELIKEAGIGGKLVSSLMKSLGGAAKASKGAAGGLSRTTRKIFKGHRSKSPSVPSIGKSYASKLNTSTSGTNANIGNVGGKNVMPTGAVNPGLGNVGGKNVMPTGAVNLGRGHAPSLAGMNPSGVSSGTTASIPGGVYSGSNKGSGFLRKFFGGTKEGLTLDPTQLGAADGVTGAGRQLGGLASGVKNIGWQLGSGYALRQGLGAIQSGLARRGANKAVKRALRSSADEVGNLSSTPVKSVDDLASFGVKHMDDAARSSAVLAGMSPKQIRALEDLEEISMSGVSARGKDLKRLEQAAGASLEDVRSRGVGRVVDQISADKGAQKANLVTETVKAVPGGGEASSTGGTAPSSGNFLTRPMGGPKARLALTAAGIGLPLAGTLGVYGAYHGMNNLAAANQQQQFRHGAYGAPVNITPTSMFPAGHVSI